MGLGGRCVPAMRQRQWGRLRNIYKRHREMLPLRIVVEEVLARVGMAPGWGNKMSD